MYTMPFTRILGSPGSKGLQDMPWGWMDKTANIFSYVLRGSEFHLDDAMHVILLCRII